MTVVELRKMTGLSQNKFAVKYHINVGTLRTWEQGLHECPEHVLYMLERVVREDMNDVLNFNRKSGQGLVLADVCPGIDDQDVVDNIHVLYGSRNSEYVYDELVDKFGKDDVIENYKSNLYPFPCFYIRSRKLHIEVHDQELHGGRWYDANNPTDVTRCKLMMKAFDLNPDDEYAMTMPMTWESIDVAKRWYAAKNELNYVVFWCEDLADFKVWLSMNCPDGRDWGHEYSWME